MVKMIRDSGESLPYLRGNEDHWLSYCALVQREYEREVENCEIGIDWAFGHIVKKLTEFEATTMWVAAAGSEDRELPHVDEMREDLRSGLLEKLKIMALDEYIPESNELSWNTV